MLHMIKIYLRRSKKIFTLLSLGKEQCPSGTDDLLKYLTFYYKFFNQKLTIKLLNEMFPLTLLAVS